MVGEHRPKQQCATGEGDDGEGPSVLVLVAQLGKLKQPVLLTYLNIKIIQKTGAEDKIGEAWDQKVLGAIGL